VSQGTYDTHKVRTVCERKLLIDFRNGKEANGWFLLDGKRAARVTVAHGRKPIPPKTYKSIANQLSLTIDELDELLDCTLKFGPYAQLLRTRKNLPAPVQPPPKPSRRR
jgi:hypothetical protein